MTRLYISQERLDEWTVEEKLSFDGSSLTLSETQQTFDVIPAVYFTGISGGDSDEHELIGTVRSEKELIDMGAEHYLTSVIYADLAYEVSQGFLGEPRNAKG